jgi:hypothetical protein
MAESARGRGASWKRLALAAALGAAGCGLFWLLFPGNSLSRIGHGMLRLPGPGSAVCVIYGPFFILVCLLSAAVLRTRWAVSLAGAAFALLHGTLTPLVLGEVKTVGVVGPWPLRVLAVLVAVAVLQLVLVLLRRRSALASHLVAAAAANLALMGFYWGILYPVARGNTVRPLAALVLAGAGTLSALIVGALIPALLARYSMPRKQE